MVKKKLAGKHILTGIYLIGALEILVRSFFNDNHPWLSSLTLCEIVFFFIYMFCGIFVFRYWPRIAFRYKSGFVGVGLQILLLVVASMPLWPNRFLSSIVSPIYFFSRELFHTARMDASPSFSEMTVTYFPPIELLTLHLLDFMYAFIVGAVIGNLLEKRKIVK